MERERSRMWRGTWGGRGVWGPVRTRWGFRSHVSDGEPVQNFEQRIDVLK